LSNHIEEAQRIAREYRFAIMPVHSVDNSGACSCHLGASCSSAGKHPRISNWPSESTCDEDTITRWWTLWPAANIGIATGAKSGIFVVDIDPRNDGFNSLDELRARIGELPSTLTVTTGSGGLHFYFKLPLQVEMQSKVAVLPGIDIRGEGGMVVAPPSLHKSGNRYEWRNSNV
jgi:putative DNA primase/helicase